MTRRKVETDQIEGYITSAVKREYTTARLNQQDADSDFQNVLDMLECNRSDKDYEWMSDVFLPEYPSIHLTEASQWANQYFQSRDFVEVSLGSADDESIAKARAAKKFINTMLNIKDLRHYPKYIRARAINSTRGYTIAVCSWKRTDRKITVTNTVPGTTGYTEEGLPIIGPVTNTVDISEPIEDRFHYEVVDPRNVFTDDKYVYSIQDKDWIIIRSEMSYDEMQGKQVENGYINLNKVKELVADTTETSKETREGGLNEGDTKVPRFDVLERFGKVWAVVAARDDDGNPVRVTKGYGKDGKILPEAEFVEMIVTVVLSGGKEILIRYQPTPFITSRGLPFRPIVRGLCYIHPTKDVGMSDGKYASELQALINDMINMGIDRAKLSMLPTLKVRRLAWEDNDSIYFEPEHSMIVENPDDITEFKIDGNITPSIEVVSMAISKMQQLESVYPTTMGELPGQASTTATAIAGADTRSNLRANYKSLTFEYTFLQEFYWMMMQMGYQFMHPKTATAILGEDAPMFDPDMDYTYRPVSTNIELEYQKDRKLQRYDGMLSRIASIPNPAIVPIIAAIIARQFELMGDEYQQYAKLVKDLAKTPNMPEQGAGQSTAGPGMAPMPTSNEEGIPMTTQEQAARPPMTGGYNA